METCDSLNGWTYGRKDKAIPIPVNELGQGINRVMGKRAEGIKRRHEEPD